MPEYTIDLPEELVQVIQSQGYSVDGYIQTMLVNPLVKRLKVKLEREALVSYKVEIDNLIDVANKKVKIKESPLLVKK